MMGWTSRSMSVIWWVAMRRESMERVRSISSRNRTVSLGRSIRRRAIPTFWMLSARIPCGRRRKRGKRVSEEKRRETKRRDSGRKRVKKTKTDLLRHQELLDRELDRLRIRLRVTREDEDGRSDDLDSEREGRRRRWYWRGLLLLVLQDVEELGNLCWIGWRESTEEELDESKHRIGGEDDLGTVDGDDGES